MTASTRDIQEFTLGALQAVGATVVSTEAGRAYRVDTLPPELQRILKRPRLHFTFDEEYVDLHREADVEFVAPGYPLLDALIARLAAVLLRTWHIAVDHIVPPGKT